MPEKIKTRIPTKEYEDNYDKIFGKKIVEVTTEGTCECGSYCGRCSFDEERMDIIGQNGNTGDHYEEEKDE